MISHPTLYKIDSKGKTRVWIANVIDDTIVVHHGIDGGQLIEETTVCTSKNVGRSNATSPEQQAIAEGLALWTKKIERDGYKEDLNDTTKFIAPMLARDYSKLSHQVPDVSLYLSPKLDGVRCIWDPSKKSLISRKGLSYNIPHLLDALNDVDEILDGEIYLHGYPLNEIVAGVKRINELTPKLEFHVFDMVIGRTYDIRDSHLQFVVRQIGSPFVKLVEQVVRDKSHIQDLHNLYVTQGYEGAMIRIPTYPYEVGTRSKSLFKYKEFEEAEFPIIDVESDKDGGAVLVCLSRGTEFRVRCRGTNERRTKQLTDKLLLVGKWVTVRYQTLTPFGVPQFGVGVSIRDYE
jgi:ATP-dependent DNA ligase